MLGAAWRGLRPRACDFAHRQGHDEGAISTPPAPRSRSREVHPWPSQNHFARNKLLLRATPFQGNDAQLTRSAEGFWHDFGQTIGTIARDTDGRLAVQERRLIRFHDTADHCLRRNDYVFRERIDEATGQREVTLKFRHPDRYRAASRDLTPAPSRDTRTKFEEDIKAPFHGLYSHSTTQPIGGSKNLNRLNDPGRLFPGLPKQLDHYDDEETIAPVGALTVRELVLTGAMSGSATARRSRRHVR